MLYLVINMHVATFFYQRGLNKTKLLDSGQKLGFYGDQRSPHLVHDGNAHFFVDLDFFNRPGDLPIVLDSSVIFLFSQNYLVFSRF